MVRSKEAPARTIDNIYSVLSSSILGNGGRKVHGICQLPQGYALSTVPPNARLIGPDEDQHNRKSTATSWYVHFITTPFSKWLRRPTFSLGDPAQCTSALSSNYNLPNGLIAIFQTLYASATLYQTQGDQIERYGYAAFGLTVAPYVVTSIVNLASTMLSPN